VEQLSASGKDQASLTSSLINGSVLKLRLFDIDGAYEDLQTAASLGSSDGRLDLLTRYSAQLKAPRHPEFLAGEDLSPGSYGESLIGHLRSVFLTN
ncbi:unnamed protein product, partial [Polarella glacialis]